MKAKAKQRQRSFPFLRINERENKPRKRGLTEIRGRITPSLVDVT